jgi:hypothetical protein
MPVIIGAVFRVLSGRTVFLRVDGLGLGLSSQK